MQQAAAHYLEDEPSRWGHYAPWALSVVAHTTIVLVLAVLCHDANSHGAGEWYGPSTGMSLDPNAVASGGATVDEGGSGDEAGGTEYYDDDAEQVHGDSFVGSDDGVAGGSASGGSENGGGGGGAGTGSEALASLLSSGPGVDLTGVLPAKGSGLGGGELESGGVGNARAATKGGGRTQGNWPKSGSAHTGVFGVSGDGYKFVYVFDRSGSMDGHGGAPLAAAKAQLLNSLDDLGQTHQFSIIFYNEHPRVFNPTGIPGRLVFANEQNRSLARKFVGGMTADGATEHEEALVLALKMAPDVIFFLTDADEPRMSSQQMQRIARLNRGSSINAIEFGYGPQQDPNNFLVRLAQQNNGHHVYVDVGHLRPAN